jgi:hypothetical protein
MNIFIKVSALCQEGCVLIFPDLVRPDVPILSMRTGNTWSLTVFIKNKKHSMSDENAVPDRSGQGYQFFSGKKREKNYEIFLLLK